MRRIPESCFRISAVPSVDPSSTAMISFSMGPRFTACTRRTTASIVLRSLYAGMMTDSFMLASEGRFLGEQDVPVLTHVNWVIGSRGLELRRHTFLGEDQDLP